MERQLSTREEILDLLKKQNELSVNGLKTNLNITDMAVRKHLNKLEGDHLIHSRTVKQSMGRPITIYFLSEKGEQLFPSNYGSMTVEFLKDIEELNGSETVNKLFEKREDRLLEIYAQRISTKNHFKNRVKELIKIQNENGYMVESCDINEDEIEFIEYHCPIFEVAGRYPKACNCELSLFNRVLETEDHVQRLSCKAQGDDNCRYVVKNKRGLKSKVTSSVK